MHRALANLKKFGLGMKSLFMDGKRATSVYTSLKARPHLIP
ncbi:hypothetical protein NGA_0165300, partial [Nannochloropsis gaditana CCMP526]